MLKPFKSSTTVLPAPIFQFCLSLTEILSLSVMLPPSFKAAVSSEAVPTSAALSFLANAVTGKMVKIIARDRKRLPIHLPLFFVFKSSLLCVEVVTEIAELYYTTSPMLK